MANISYLIIIFGFVLYYALIVLFERELILEPKIIIEKFLSFALGYAGLSLIYFSLTGKPLFTDNINEYFVYIFIIGFISLLWAIPTLLQEFSFFRKFMKGNKIRFKK